MKVKTHHLRQFSQSEAGRLEMKLHYGFLILLFHVIGILADGSNENVSFELLLWGFLSTLQFQRVHGGTDAVPGTFEFVSQIFMTLPLKQPEESYTWYWNYSCSSSIVSTRHILTVTAAHCVVDTEPIAMNHSAERWVP